MNMTRRTLKMGFVVGAALARTPHIMSLPDFTAQCKGYGIIVDKPKNNTTPTSSATVAKQSKPPLTPKAAGIIKEAVNDLVDRMDVELTEQVIEKFGHLFLPQLVRVKESEYETALDLIENLAINHFELRVQKTTPVPTPVQEPISVEERQIRERVGQYLAYWGWQELGARGLSNLTDIIRAMRQAFANRPQETPLNEPLPVSDMAAE